MLRLVLICILLIVSGCETDSSSSGPPTANETSETTTALADRVKFIEQYVRFRREYEDLEYSVVYQNNGTGRGVPGPSDWDIRLVAIVPPEQIREWVPADAVEATALEAEWLETTAKKIDVSSINQWYINGNTSIGIDRDNSIVAFRSHTFGH
jgi:hypothetical protein